MRVYYDLHIHSALSPCADDDMTPNNIVNMSLLKGLDVIAVTDHNTCGNVRAVQEVAAGRLLVIPGMEVETEEEVHVLCYFPSLAQAEALEAALRQHCLPVKNKPEIFGNQYYMDASDTIVGQEPQLLVSAIQLSIYEVVSRTKALGGVAVPAHIDRSSYSVLSNLGFLPPDLGVGALEITAAKVDAMAAEFTEYAILTDSDAHYLGDIAERERFFDVSTKTVSEILSKFTKDILK